MTDVRFASRLFRGFAAGAFIVGLTVAAPAVLAQPAPTPAPAATPAAPPATPPATPGTPSATPGTPAPTPTPAVGPDGLPLPAAPAPAAGAPPAVGPDGLPVAATPGAPATPATPATPPPMRPVVGPDGKPVLGPDGQPLMEPVPVPVVAPTPPAPEPPPPPKKKEPIKGDFFGLTVMIQPEDEYSLFGLFMIAHPVVKIVMIGLFIASVVSWAILISKLIYLSRLNTRTTKFVNDFRASNALLQEMSRSMSGSDRTVPPAQMVEAAATEIDLTFAQGPASTGEKRDHLTQRIASAMAIGQASRSAELGSGMPFLATTGSIATFVGLFGTVWGIMYSFIGIAQSKSTNLAVVAPGIAEALLATAMGLFAAIPAVVFYNIFSRRIAAYNQRLDNFSSELLIRVSRQLDQSAG